MNAAKNATAPSIDSHAQICVISEFLHEVEGSALGAVGPNRETPQL